MIDQVKDEQQGIIIVLGTAGKGGCSKSSTCVNLAGAFAAKGKNVAIVDTDVGSSVMNTRGSRSTTEWIEDRRYLIEEEGHDYPAISGYMLSPDSKIHGELRRLTKVHDVVIVDTAGSATMALKSAVAVCDMVYVPFNCTRVEMRALFAMFEMHADLEQSLQMANPNAYIDMRLLPTRIMHNWKIDRGDYREWYESGINKQASISSVAIPTSVRIAEGLGAGWSLHDKKDQKRAVFDLLVDEIEGRRQVREQRIFE